jgi:hypothetical protein
MIGLGGSAVMSENRGLGGSAVMSKNRNLLYNIYLDYSKKSIPEQNLLLNDFSRIILELNCYQKIYTERSKMRNGT